MSRQSENTAIVVAIYHFVGLEDFEALKPPLLDVCPGLFNALYFMIASGVPKAALL